MNAHNKNRSVGNGNDGKAAAAQRAAAAAQKQAAAAQRAAAVAQKEAVAAQHKAAAAQNAAKEAQREEAAHRGGLPSKNPGRVSGKGRDNNPPHDTSGIPKFQLPEIEGTDEDYEDYGGDYMCGMNDQG